MHCVEPSEAITVARQNLAHLANCTFHQCGIAAMPFPDASMDFGYCLGVLHHMPDPQQGMDDCVRKLKRGAPLLVYLYYDFDNQPAWFRLLWRCSDGLRRGISRLPHRLKSWLCEIIAVVVYYPLARTARLLEKTGLPMHSFPLSGYRNMSLYSMRVNALDRFGTRLEHRFTKPEIANMMTAAGLEGIRFSANPPFYCAIGFKK